MSKAHRSFSYDKRYKHKLNMLGPGQIMMKAALILSGVGAVFYMLAVRVAYLICWGAAGALILLLLILVGVELHQDRVLYELAKSQDPDIK